MKEKEFEMKLNNNTHTQSDGSMNVEKIHPDRNMESTV